MAFELEKFHIERVNVEVHYHASYTFQGLKGVVAERWAHGPLFGAVSEPGPDQLNLVPPSEVEDQRLVAVLGLRASGLLAEGPKWTSQAPKIANEWIRDVFTALKPQRTIRVVSELLGLYPISDPYAATRRLIGRYYNGDELTSLAGRDRFLAAVDIFAPSEEATTTLVIGAIGPPHRGLFFNIPNEERDRQWWMGIRANYVVYEEEGVADPSGVLAKALDSSYSEVSRAVRTAFPAITDA